MAEETAAVEEPVVERESIRGIRPSTDANIVIQLLVGVLGTVGTAFAVFPFKGKYIYGIINQRGPVQYGELFMAFMVAALMFLKARIVNKQLRAMSESSVTAATDLSDDEHVHMVRQEIAKRDDFSWSIVLNRMDRMLALWLGSKDVSRVATYASSESSRDTAAADSSYALSRVLIWAIPILGFIGTVQGLGQAVSGFGVLGGAAEISAIKGAIGQVTVGLGVAFDTTLLALTLVVFLMFPLTSLQRKEEFLFVEIDNYLEDSILSRLPSAGQQPIVIENLEDSIEAAFRRYIPDPDRYDEVFTRSIEKAASTVEERFSNLTKNYEMTLRDMTQRLSASMSTVGESLETSWRKVATDLQSQEDSVMASRKQIAQEEATQFKTLLEDVHQSAQKVAVQYQESSRQLQAAAQESAGQTLEAAKQIGTRMEEVSKLAAGIEDLLRIQDAVQKGLAGIASSEDFRKTLEELRHHLSVTNDFCTRLSKPRVITLREEMRS